MGRPLLEAEGGGGKALGCSSLVFRLQVLQPRQCGFIDVRGEVEEEEEIHGECEQEATGSARVAAKAVPNNHTDQECGEC